MDWEGLGGHSATSVWEVKKRKSIALQVFRRLKEGKEDCWKVIALQVFGRLKRVERGRKGGWMGLTALVLPFLYYFRKLGNFGGLEKLYKEGRKGAVGLWNP